MLTNASKEKTLGFYMLALACANANSKKPQKLLKDLVTELKKYDKTNNIEIGKEELKTNLEKLKRLFKQTAD